LWVSSSASSGWRCAARRRPRTTAPLWPLLSASSSSNPSTRPRCWAGSSVGKPPLIEAFNSDGDRTGPIKNRHVARHSAEQDDPGLRDAAAAVVDHEVIGTPESERPGREIESPLDVRQGRREIAGL